MFLYKTTGRTKLVNDDPENPNQPKRPVKIIPSQTGTTDNPIVAFPYPVFSEPTQIRSGPVPHPGGGGGDNPQPSGPDGDYVLLSRLRNGGYSGISLQPGTVIIDDL